MGLSKKLVKLLKSFDIQLDMNLKRLYRKLTKKFKDSGFLKILRRFLFEQSHLSPYLPILKQRKQDKIIRIYNDSAYKNNQMNLGAHRTDHKKQEQFSNFFFITKVCYNPLNNWLIVWYALVFLSIILAYFITGIGLFFGDDAWNEIHTSPEIIFLNVYCIIIFLCDIFVQLNTGFLFRGMIIIDKQRTIRRYLRNYLFIDIFLILVLIASMASTYFYLNVFKLVVVLKFIRMFEIDQFYLRKLSITLNLKAVYVISKQILTIVIIAHTIGCFFYAMDYALTQDPMCIDNPQLCWLNSATAYSPIISLTWRFRYFYSFYWGIDTISTISYGDIAPANPYQTIYEIFVFCLSFVVFGYLVNNIVGIISWARTPMDNFRGQLILYTTFMDNLQISLEAQYEFREYLSTHFLIQKQRDFELQQQMKQKLPTDLRNQLLKNAYQKMFDGIEHMLLNSPSIIRLLYSLQEKRCIENEQILIQGAPIDKLYYLHKGEVRLVCTYNRQLHPITTLNDDSFLSLYQFFENQRSTYSITTSKNSTFYFIDKEQIQEEIQKHTDLRENFRLLEYQLRIMKNYQKIFYSCYFCRVNHHWFQCTNHFPNFSKVSLAKYSQKQQAKRKRVLFNYYNVWKNKKAMADFQRKSENFAYRILRRVQDKLYQLKRIKQEIRNDFDVDFHHEWTYYRSDLNLSKFKEHWNKTKQMKSQPSQSIDFLNLFGL